jgi:hypothetical protein
MEKFMEAMQKRDADQFQQLGRMISDALQQVQQRPALPTTTTTVYAAPPAPKRRAKAKSLTLADAYGAFMAEKLELAQQKQRQIGGILATLKKQLLPLNRLVKDKSAHLNSLKNPKEIKGALADYQKALDDRAAAQERMQNYEEALAATASEVLLIRQQLDKPDTSQLPEDDRAQFEIYAQQLANLAAEEEMTRAAEKSEKAEARKQAKKAAAQRTKWVVASPLRGETEERDKQLYADEGDAEEGDSENERSSDASRSDTDRDYVTDEDLPGLQEAKSSDERKGSVDNPPGVNEPPPVSATGATQAGSGAGGIELKEASTESGDSGRDESAASHPRQSGPSVHPESAAAIKARGENENLPAQPAAAASETAPPPLLNLSQNLAQLQLNPARRNSVQPSTNSRAFDEFIDHSARVMNAPATQRARVLKEAQSAALQNLAGRLGRAGVQDERIETANRASASNREVASFTRAVFDYYKPDDGTQFRGRDDPARVTLRYAFERFEEKMGAMLFRHGGKVLELNDNSQPRDAFRIAVGKPRYALMIINAFPQHLVDADASSKWRTLQSSLYDARKRQLLEEFAPNVDEATRAYDAFVWDDKESAKTLLRRAGDTARDLMTADQSYNYSDQNTWDMELRRRIGDLLRSALRNHETAQQQLIGWFAKRKGVFTLAEAETEISGLLAGLTSTGRPRRTRASAAAAAAADESEDENSSATSVRSTKIKTKNTKKDKDKAKERQQKKHIHGAMEVFNALTGKLDFSKVSNKNAREALQLARGGGGQAPFRPRKCFKCQNFVGLIDGITDESAGSHMAAECPHKDAIERAFAQLRSMKGRAPSASLHAMTAASAAAMPPTTAADFNTVAATPAFSVDVTANPALALSQALNAMMSQQRQ